MRPFLFVLAALVSGTSVHAQSPLEILGSQTPNVGQYANRIPAFAPPNNYTEICVSGGSVAFETKLAGQSTAGGACEPGDIGWVIEQDQRTADTWEMAKMDCLVASMRLPEPFEWKFSCKNESDYGLNDMTGDQEWASNTTLHDEGSAHGVVAVVMGLSSCSHGGEFWVAALNGSEQSTPFRCVK